MIAHTMMTAGQSKMRPGGAASIFVLMTHCTILPAERVGDCATLLTWLEICLWWMTLSPKPLGPTWTIAVVLWV